MTDEWGGGLENLKVWEASCVPIGVNRHADGKLGAGKEQCVAELKILSSYY
ncbi:hypothetical protein F9C07_12075 [Aspergillus flavus]|uniref:Uncharacterized protein n=1 Tax=Aspergillus flavus (strain ATCC 200026 / FGSC A1120 / IAM 13836 / NRRL 3357 / JCM 12722 / SRRC 167) TaxID=332952 RepID=A0A7U2N2K9_ASPFN|nr:hypothetical protein F9C07_12075 [Aspergillus flavus]